MNAGHGERPERPDRQSDAPPSTRMRAGAPFLAWPTHLCDPRFGFAWYAEPAVFVNQIQVPHGTTEVAGALHDAIDQVLVHHADDIVRHGGLLILHDWRLMRGYDTEARRQYVARMESRKPGYLRKVVAVLPDAPLLKMAVQTANIVMAFSSGGTLSFETDPKVALEKYSIRLPRADAWR